MKHKSSDIFKSRIKELMAGKKQIVVSKEIGIAQNTLSDYINLGKNPSYTIIIRLAKYFGVSADWLLGLSNCKSTDEATKEQCKAIGLSDTAINLIKSNENVKNIIEGLVNQHINYEKADDGYFTRLKEIIEWCAKESGTANFDLLYGIFREIERRSN